MDFFPSSVLLGVLLIFAFRVADVSLGTIRTIMMVKGRYLVAGAIGFVEVSIFIIAIAQVLNHMDTIFHILGYSGGFACGTILGGFLENKMALGYYMISIHCRNDWRLIAGELRSEGFGATEYTAEGKDGLLHVVDTLVRRKDFPKAMDIITAIAPEAFVNVDEQQYIRHGYIHHFLKK